MEKFCLSQEFVSNYKVIPPDWGFGDLGHVVYLDKYARVRPEDGRRELWHQTCERVVNGMYRTQQEYAAMIRIPWNPDKAQRSAREAYDRMFHMMWLPPGRGLWAMGTDIPEKKGGAALNNCAFVSTTDMDAPNSNGVAAPFAWAMDLLMLGVGVGFDTNGAGRWLVRPSLPASYTYTVPDTREGWVNALIRKINSYNGGRSYSYDFSEIRPYGSTIYTFGGTASGPAPLRELLESVDRLLVCYVGTCLDSAGIVDLFNLVGRCVRSGNVRRSAQIALGSPEDKTFLSLKDPRTAGDALRSHRWASNNSVKACVGMDYSALAEQTRYNGEPGYVWAENFRYGRMLQPAFGVPLDPAVGVNPCGEQPLASKEMCTLVETFPARHPTLEDWMRTLKFAYLYAKTVTLMPTHSEESNSVMAANRRIGTSVSGVVQAKQKFGTREFLLGLSRGYDEVRRYDALYSKWLGVPNSVRVTTVKPSGTVSLLAGATPGMHYPHSEYYIRRLRLPSGHFLVDVLRGAGYNMSVDVVDAGSMVVDFPVRENVRRSKADVGLWEQLETAASLQHYWSDNAVSCTITFDQETEGKNIAAALSYYESRLKTASFLPLSDHGYDQAPYETIDSHVYSSMTSKIRPLGEIPDVGDGTGPDKFCTNDTCV